MHYGVYGVTIAVRCMVGCTQGSSMRTYSGQPSHLMTSLLDAHKSVWYAHERHGAGMYAYTNRRILMHIHTDIDIHTSRSSGRHTKKQSHRWTKKDHTIRNHDIFTIRLMQFVTDASNFFHASEALIRFTVVYCICAGSIIPSLPLPLFPSLPSVALPLSRPRDRLPMEEV